MTDTAGTTHTLQGGSRTGSMRDDMKDYLAHANEVGDAARWRQGWAQAGLDLMVPSVQSHRVCLALEAVISEQEERNSGVAPFFPIIVGR